ncbi:hypothetical protein GEMRC1_005386 [Eukaryota sp. GEM-RC1]
MKRCAQTADKHRIINSDVFTASNIILTTEECTSILSTYKDKEDRINAFEVLSVYIPSFNVADVAEILPMVANDDEMKVVEICSEKLVCALPFDCEPIYYALSKDEDKTKAREMLSSQIVPSICDIPVYPTVDMLIESLNPPKRLRENELFNVLNSWMESVPVSNTVITREECESVFWAFRDSEECIGVFELLSKYKPSFDVSDVTKFVQMFTENDQMKVIEICSPKLVYALPFDCEPIYYAISKDEDKTKARELITSQKATLLDQEVIPVYPTVDMLFKALNPPNTLGRNEMVNILNSWLVSVPNVSFIFEEVVKLLEDLHGEDDDQEVKQDNRLEVLQLVHHIMESPLSVDQVMKLLNSFTHHQRRLDALLIVVEKMVFHTLWQLVGIIRMFKTSTHRNKVRSVLESVKCNQQPIDQPQKKSESIGQSDMVPYLISQFFTPGASDAELFSSIASHIASVSDVFLSSESFDIIMSFFSNNDEVLKAFDLLHGYTQSITVDVLARLLNRLGFSAIDEKLRAVEAWADKLVYDDLSECERLCKNYFSNNGDKAMEIIESRSRPVSSQRKKVPVPTMIELIDAVKEAIHSDEKLSFLRSWAASVPNPVICVNDFDELLKHFPNEKDTVSSILGDATFSRPRPKIDVLFNDTRYGSTNRKIVSIGRYLLRESNLLFTPWDLAVIVSCIPNIDGKIKLIELCSPLLEYERPSECEVIYKCISGEDNKSMAREFVESSAEADSSLLETFLDNWKKDDALFDNMNINDPLFRWLELTEDEFWKWFKKFHFDENRNRAYRILIKKIVPPPSWAEELAPTDDDDVDGRFFG